jgi:hypothetical protein
MKIHAVEKIERDSKVQKPSEFFLEGLCRRRRVTRITLQRDGQDIVGFASTVNLPTVLGCSKFWQSFVRPKLGWR